MTRARDVANLIGSGNYSSTTFTATAGQTAFTISHTQGFVQVFMNGLLLDETVDYTSNGSAVTLTSGAAAGDEIEVVAYNTFSVGDALNQAAADARYVNTAGDTMTGNLQSTELVANNAGNNTNIRVQNTASGSGSSDGFVIQNATNSKVYLWNYENSDVLFGTNSIERLKIDSAGRVTTPNQPAFSTRGTNYTQANSWTIVKPATTELNVGSHYNSSTGVWTVPVAGNYIVAANGLAYPSGTSGSGPVFNTGWYKNGAIWEDIQNGEFYSNHTNFINTAIIPCAANDTLDFRFYRGSGTVLAYTSQFNMYGYLLG